MSRKPSTAKVRELSPATEFKRKRNSILGIKYGSCSSTAAMNQSDITVNHVSEAGDQKRPRAVPANRGVSSQTVSSVTSSQGVQMPNHGNDILPSQQRSRFANRKCPYAGCASLSPVRQDTSYFEKVDYSQEISSELSNGNDKDRIVTRSRSKRNTERPRQHDIEPNCISKKPQCQSQGQSQNRIMTEQEVKDILDENEKLRLVEREFWTIFKEKEDIRDEVVALKRQLIEVTNKIQPFEQHCSNENPLISSTIYSNGKRTVEDILDDTVRRAKGKISVEWNGSTIRRDDCDRDIIQQLKLEVETLQIALHDCMDLLIQSDMKGVELPSGLGNIQRDGPVAVFLRWVNMTQNKQRSRAEINEVLNDIDSTTLYQQSPTTCQYRKVSMSPVRTSEESLITVKHHQTLEQLRKVQQELDRTDLSRQQALDDAEKIRRQMELLAANLSDVKNAFKQYKYNVDANSKSISEREAALEQHQKGRLAQKDAEIHELKARVVQLERMVENGTIELAKDTERISRDLKARRSQSGHRAYSQEHFDDL